MIESFVDEFSRYRAIAEKALAQVPDGKLNEAPGADNNSMAVLVGHISGNLVSRFTDFLTSDGEKAWRDRDAEFEYQVSSREEVTRTWMKGWGVLEVQLAGLTDSDLEKQVFIRGQALAVHQALARSVAHVAYHVGQMVLLARVFQGREWEWISIPKGKSAEYNQNPTREKKPH